LPLIAATSAAVVLAMALMAGVLLRRVDSEPERWLDLEPLAGGWLYDAFGSYARLIIGSCGSGVRAVAIACTFRGLRSLPAALPAPSVAH
jgi:hypothetical protein